MSISGPIYILGIISFTNPLVYFIYRSVPTPHPCNHCSDFKDYSRIISPRMLVPVWFTCVLLWAGCLPLSVNLIHCSVDRKSLHDVTVVDATECLIKQLQSFVWLCSFCSPFSYLSHGAYNEELVFTSNLGGQGRKVCPPDHHAVVGILFPDVAGSKTC